MTIILHQLPGGMASTLVAAATEMGYGVLGIAAAGIKGEKGNQEYFFLLRYGHLSVFNDKMVRNVVECI